MKYIAKYLSMPYISVYEVATFYSMYNLAPVGKHFIQVCTTTPCLIRGADKIVKLCKEKFPQMKTKFQKKRKLFMDGGRVFRSMCERSNDTN